MLKIVFKNMESSQLAKDFVLGKFHPILETFPLLQSHNITLCLEMKNSFKEARPDLFTVSSVVSGITYKGLKLKRSSGNFFQAITELADGLNELLSLDLDHLIISKSK